jgi:predicted acylesterase/phospholipase RssA
VGVALSGGAARGLAHIGVLKVLEEEGLPVDVVSGTSMGALVGGLYAMGYPTAQLERIVEEIDMAAVFTGEADRDALRLEQRRLPSETVVNLPVEGTRVHLPSGLRTGQAALVALSRLTWPVHGVEDLTALPRPFAAVAVDLRAGEAVTLTDGDLADAMYASMALPSALMPARHDDRLLVDGGLVRNLPTEDAFDLGADVVISVDVTGTVDGDKLVPIGEGGDASAIDVLIEAAALGNRAGIQAQRERATVLLEPELDGLGRLDFDRVPDFIARGEAAARAQLPALRALLDRVGGPVSPSSGVPAPSAVSVERLRVTGVPSGSGAAALVRSRVDLDLPRSIRPKEAEAAVNRVYGTGLFDRVSYRVLPGTDGRPGELVIRVEPQATPDRLGVGFRYDEFYGPGLLVSLALKNRLRFGDTAAITARLGRQFEVRGSYFTRLATGSPLTAGAELGFASAPYDEYDSRDPAADADPIQYRQRVWSGSLFGGLALSEAALVGVRVRAERQSTLTVAVPSAEEELFEIDNPYAPLVEERTGMSFEDDPIPFIVGLDGVSFRSTVLSAGLFTEIDTRDRIAFPRRGVRVRAEAALGRADADEGRRRAAYRNAFLNAYDRFDVPEILVDDAPDPDAAEDQIESEVRAEVEEEVAEDAAEEFPGRPFAPFRRFVVDVEAAVPAGPATVFGRAAYSQGDGAGLPASAFTAVGGIHASAVYAESFFPLAGLRPQQLVGTRGYLGVLGLQAEVRGVVLRGFVNVGDAYGEEDRIAEGIDDEDDDSEIDDDDEGDEDVPVTGFNLRRAAFGGGIEIGVRTPLGPASVIVGTTQLDRRPNVGINLGFEF